MADTNDEILLKELGLRVSALQHENAHLKAEVERLRAFEADVELEVVAWLDVSEATADLTPTQRVLLAVGAMHADAKAHQEAQRAASPKK